MHASFDPRNPLPYPTDLLDNHIFAPFSADKLLFSYFVCITIPIVYKVRFVITPINYAKGFSKAIKERRADTPITSLEEIDIKILDTLSGLRKAMRERPLMLHTSGRINRHGMLNALDRLIAAGYITRLKIKNKVLYAITTSGRALIDELNERIIQIVEADARAIAEGRI
jgi:hypothetical protein